MSMEHKAYIFDTEDFESNLKELLLDAGLSDNVEAIKAFIEENADSITSPYTFEPIDEDWEEELEANDVQEYADFAMTAYYEPEEDIGLSYTWNAVMEGLKATGFEDAEVCVLGNPVEKDGFSVDPGRCGLGLISAENVQKLYQKLSNIKADFCDINIEDLDIEDDIEQEELEDVFDDLLSIYESALDENKGIMFTF